MNALLTNSNSKANISSNYFQKLVSLIKVSWGGSVTNWRGGDGVDQVRGSDKTDS